MRRVTLAALTLAAAAGGSPLRVAQGRAVGTATSDRDDLAEPRGRHQLRPRRPLAGHELLRRHPGRARLPGETATQTSRSGSTPASARCTRPRRTSSSSSLRGTPASTRTSPTRPGHDLRRRRPHAARGASTTSARSTSTGRCRTTSPASRRTPTSTAPTPTSASRSGPTRRAPTSSASRRPTSTTTRTPAEQSRAAALGGRRHLDAAAHPGASPPSVLGYYWYSADDTTEEEITVAEGDSASSTTRPRTCASAAASATPTASATETIGGVRDTTEHDTGPGSAATSATSTETSPCSARPAGPPPPRTA